MRLIGFPLPTGNCVRPWVTPVFKDFNQTDEMIKTKVELGRILGLLRLCLTQAENFPLESRAGFRETVTDVIQEVEDNQANLKAIIQRAVRS